MTAGRCDLQRPLGGLLALDLAQVGLAFGRAHGTGPGLAQHLGPAEMVHQGDQRGRGQHPGLAGPGRLRSAGLGADQAQAHPARGDRGGQGAGHLHDAPVQRQLADRGPFAEGVRRNDPHRRHHRERDGQVVVAAGLRQVGGRQVGDDPPAGQRQPDPREGGAHALAALRHRLVAQADQDEVLFSAGELDLDVHPSRFDTLERQRDDPRSHVCPSSPFLRTWPGAAPHSPASVIHKSAPGPRAQIKNKNGTFGEDETIP